jgi:hypothetical protein
VRERHSVAPQHGKIKRLSLRAISGCALPKNTSSDPCICSSVCKNAGSKFPFSHDIGASVYYSIAQYLELPRSDED